MLFETFLLLISLSGSLAQGGRYTVNITFNTKWSFDGLNYEYVYEYAEVDSKHELRTCAGEWIRCTLRLPYIQKICAIDYYEVTYRNYYSICEIEYANCIDIIANWYSYPNRYTLNVRLFDGYGWECNEVWRMNG